MSQNIYFFRIEDLVQQDNVLVNCKHFNVLSVLRYLSGAHLYVNP